MSDGLRIVLLLVVLVAALLAAGWADGLEVQRLQGTYEGVSP